VQDPAEALRRLTVHDDAFIESMLGATPGVAAYGLDARTLALGRIAALVALGGPLGSYLSRVDAALHEGATGEEIVGLLMGIAHDVGEARAIAAASAIGQALGFDVIPG
jgi:4-carboxymuconolactone decarboxylase